MKVHSSIADALCCAERPSTAEIIKKLLPDIDPDYLSARPDMFDRAYIKGEARGTSIFRPNGYLNKKAALDEYISNLHSGQNNGFKRISASDVRTNKESWATVLAGKRPMGQFTVDSLFSPELHAVLEQPKIGSKIFSDPLNPIRFVVVIYRIDCEEGERSATRFIELYYKKIELIDDSAKERYEMKDLQSELVVAKEMGDLLYYLPEEIDEYLREVSKAINKLQHA